MTEPYDIDAADGIIAAATPGPWEAMKYGDGSQDGKDLANIGVPDLCVILAEHLPERDAIFIAAARTGWPAANAALREARKRIAELEAQVASWQNATHNSDSLGTIREQERDEAREIARKYANHNGTNREPHCCAHISGPCYCGYDEALAKMKGWGE